MGLEVSAIVIVQFTTRDGKLGSVRGVPGTNFGLRLSNEEVERLEATYGIDNLPFLVMAEGYGDDEDWVAIQSAETHEDNDLAKPLDVAHYKWAPYEASADESVPSSLQTLGRFRVHDFEGETGPHFFVNDSETGKTVSVTFETNAEAREYADELNADPSKVTPFGDTTAPGTPEWALDRLASFIGVVGEVPTDVDAAIIILDSFIKQVNERGSSDLEWGEPGDCWERLYSQPEYREDPLFAPLLEASDDASGGPEDEAVQAYAKAHGLGRHYGDPHCIWCLQAS